MSLLRYTSCTPPASKAPNEVRVAASSHDRPFRFVHLLSLLSLLSDELCCLVGTLGLIAVSDVQYIRYLHSGNFLGVSMVALGRFL